MATGGLASRTAMSEPRRKPTTTAYRLTNLTDDEPSSLGSGNLLEDRPNNWDFSDWRPSTVFDRSKKLKKDNNPEKEKEEQALSQESASPQINKVRQRTPQTFPRTRITATTPASQRAALENLRQFLTFSDAGSEMSTEVGERNNERNVSNKRGKAANFKVQEPGRDNNRNRNISGGGEDGQPDSNQVVGRLMQIRDYLKQATAMMENLHRTGDAQSNRDQVSKLSRLISHLREQEKGYMSLLQKMLASRDETLLVVDNSGGSSNSKMESLAESASIDLDMQSDAMSECTTSDVGEKNEELEALQQQHDLLKKMLDQQEQLRALQGRQAALLALQRDAEQKLSQQNDQPQHNRGTLPFFTSNIGNILSSGGELDNQEVTSTTDNTNTENTTQSDSEDDNENENTETAAADSEIVPQELKDLRRRLQYLKNLYEMKEGVSAVNQSETEQKSNMSVAESDISTTSMERRYLRDKLRDLQDKKHHMDDLLKELQTMRKKKYQQMNNEAELGSTTSSVVHLNESIAATASANQTAREAQEMLGLLETRKTHKKLQEVKDRLNQLRDLVQYYQTGHEFIHENADDGDMSSMLAFSDYEDPELMRNLKKLKAKGSVSKRLEQYAKESQREYTSQQQQQHEQQRQQQQRRQQREEDTASQADTTDTESQLSSNLGQLGEDPDIKEKVRKLRAAKEKLRRLQELVAMVQQSPDAAGALPDDLAELAASIDGDGDTTSQTTQTDAENTTSNSTNSRGGGGQAAEPPYQSTEEFYEAKMEQQREELDQLVVERKKLLAIQGQLQKLQQEFPGVGSPGGRSRDPNATRVKKAAGTKEKETVTFQEPDEVPSNDELWDKMRMQRMLREELRQKKRELEDMMRKDRPRKQYSRNQDTQSDNISFSNKSDPFGASMISGDATMATWGGSTVDNLIDIEEDENGSGAGQEADDDEEEEEDDGYPSDGIVQVEEEEEAQAESDNETYTIEDDFRQRQRTRKYRAPVIDGSRLQRNTATVDPQDPRSRVSRAYQPYMSAQSNRAQRTRQQAPAGMGDNQGDLAAGGDREDQIRHLKAQLENMLQVCTTILPEAQLNLHLQGMTPPLRAGFSPYGGDVNQQYQQQQQVQYQQLLMSLNQCYSHLYSQQQDMMGLQQQLHHILTQHGGGPGGLRDSEDEDPQVDSPARPHSNMSWYNPYTLPPYSGLAPYGLSPSTMLGVPGGPGGAARPASGLFNFRPQFPSGFSPNNAASAGLGAGMSEQWRAALDQGELPFAAEHSPNPAVGGGASRHPTEPAPLPQRAEIPKLNLDDILKPRKNRSGKAPPKPEESIKSSVRSSVRSSARSETSSKADSAVIKHKYPTPSRANAAASLASRQRHSDNFRPGLSAGICGTAFTDNTSMSSALSSVPGGENAANMSARSRQQQQQQQQQQVLQAKHQQQQKQMHQQGIKSTSELESDAPSDFSLFEALRETIYSEVATLISQNENRPHFLIELFRELQMLTSDYLRQRALYAIQELVTRFLTEESVGGEVRANPPRWLIQGANNNTSEQTPSESLITSDEEEVRARLYAQNPNLFRELGLGTASERSTSMKSSSQVAGSIRSDRFDYMENVETTSSLSTPPSTGYWESPFNQESLGDTVIHLDKALHRMREYERKLAEAKGEDAHGASPTNLKRHLQPPEKKSGDTTSEVTSSSAQDQGSESSISDVPYPRIDTQELDRQIKGIMTEVIPVLKEHMDDMCSQQLLQYIKRLVLSLTKQKDDSQEFVRFFHKQLGSILSDSLAKFEGRKMRECGEDLLVDMSEILFNELAFFRLMQDLDDPGSKAKARMKQWSQRSFQDSQTSTETSQAEQDGELEDEDDEEETSEETEESESSARDGDGDDGPAEGATGGGGAEPNEEEELGKARDDEFASKVDIKEEDSGTPMKSPVKIELAVSETKPFTRIGSDEDDDDEEEEEEAQSAQDPSETAVSRDAEKEKCAEEKEQDSAPATETSSAPCEVEKGAEPEEIPSKESPVSVSVSAPEQQDTSGDQAEKLEDSTPTSEDAAPQVNGEVNGEEEITIDDLPPRLTGLSEVELQTKVSEEQKDEAGAAAVLAVVGGLGEEGGEAELAGDGAALKEPEESTA